MARSSRDTFTRSNSRGEAWRAASVLVALAAGLAAAQNPDDAALRVCADPSNLPLSNERGEGYENKIAQLLARDLNRHVEFTYFPQRMGFVRNTLRQKDEATQRFKCDVIIGVPKGFELAATTQPYMRSTYALVFKARDEFAPLQAPDDLMKLPAARLQQMRIGVFGRSPGADWLLRNGLMSHAVFYAPQTGDPAESTAHVVEQDLLEGKTDMAIVWGPIAGFLVGQHQDSPAWRALPFKPDPTIKFDYEISMGVRFGEKEWKETLDQWIRTHQDEVRSILVGYHVPLLDIKRDDS